ncbi:MAG: hypothetical protein AAF085_03070, partial [Planctomycetota bacterium]
MHYVIFVPNGDDHSDLYVGPVDDRDAAYLQQAIEHLSPMTDEQYLIGPAALLQAAVRYSYILHEKIVYWCIEYQPGLLIVRLASDDELHWAAIRSPVPDFGGREPLPEDGDPDTYEDDENPQINLI